MPAHANSAIPKRVSSDARRSSRVRSDSDMRVCLIGIQFDRHPISRCPLDSGLPVFGGNGQLDGLVGRLIGRLTGGLR